MKWGDEKGKGDEVEKKKKKKKDGDVNNDNDTMWFRIMCIFSVFFFIIIVIIVVVATSFIIETRAPRPLQNVEYIKYLSVYILLVWSFAFAQFQ